MNSICEDGGEAPRGEFCGTDSGGMNSICEDGGEIAQAVSSNANGKMSPRQARSKSTPDFPTKTPNSPRGASPAPQAKPKATRAVTWEASASGTDSRGMNPIGENCGEIAQAVSSNANGKMSPRQARSKSTP